MPQNWVRFLNVQILLGETTQFQVHRASTFYADFDVSSADTQTSGGDRRHTRVSGWRSGGVAYFLDKAQQPLTHRVRDVGTESFRKMVDLFKRPCRFATGNRIRFLLFEYHLN